MATNKKKQQRKQKKAQEAAKIAKKTSRSRDDSREGVYESQGLKDSKGKSIPTEEERRDNPKVLSFADIKDGKGEKARAARRNVRRYGQTKSATPAKRKVKYVLDKAAKRWLIKVGAVAIIVIAAVIAGIFIASAVNSPKPANTASEKQKMISLTGITSQGKLLIEATGKYDGFLLDDSGVPKAGIYDTDITLEDAEVLKARSQYPSEGIFTYNEEQALRDKPSNTNENLAPENDTVKGALQ